MTDDTIKRYRSLVGPREPQAPAKPTVDFESMARSPEAEPEYEPYAAFKNDQRMNNVEIRCNSSGLSYFVEYAQMSPIVFKFRGGDAIFFSAGGFSFEIRGTSLRRIISALRLHTAGTIQEFDPDLHVDREPPEPSTLLVQSIVVKVLRPQKPAPSGGKGKEEKTEKEEKAEAEDAQ
jgi:hypothetical protein